MKHLLLCWLALAQPEFEYPSEFPSEDSSYHIWHLLRSTDASILLHGLPQRLAVVAAKERMAVGAGPEKKGECRLVLGIRTEGEITQPIHIGLFRSHQWWLESPVHVRTVQKGGVHTLTGLTSGDYVVGAIVGSFPYLQAAGVHLGWPDPVAVSEDSAARVRVLVSREFQWESYPKVTFTRLDSRNAGHRKRLTEKAKGHLIRVRVKDESGAAVPYSQVRIDLDNGGASGEVIRESTDSFGEAYFEVGADAQRLAVNCETLSTSLHPLRTTSRWLKGGLRSAPKPNSTIEIRVPSVSNTWTGTVQGTICDHHGRAVRGCRVVLQTPERDIRLGNYVPPPFRMTSWITNAAGEFSFFGVPAGKYLIIAHPFDSERYVWEPGGTAVEMSEETATPVDCNITLEAKQLFYGRVLTPEGDGAYPAAVFATHSEDDAGEVITSFVQAHTDATGMFRAALSHEEYHSFLRTLDGWLTIYETEEPGRRTRVQISSLSTDMSEPTAIGLPEAVE